MTMRTKLSTPELAALEARVRQLMNGVKHEEYLDNGSRTQSGLWITRPGPHRYFPINCPAYCEAFGMIQALETLGFGQMGGVGPKVPKGVHIFDLRKWFDDVIESVLKERP